MADPYQDHPNVAPVANSVWSSQGGATFWVAGSVAVALPAILASTYGASVSATAAVNKTAIDTALAVALAAGGGIVVLPGGTNAAPLLTNGGHDVPAGVEIWGFGSSTATVVINRSATYTFRLANTTSGQQAGALRRIQVVGSDATRVAVNGGIGVELGNGLMHVLEDVFIYGFTGVGSVGVRLHNTVGGAPITYVEQSEFRKVLISNCTTLIQFLSDAGAGTSFGYTNMRGVELQLYANQVGIDVGGAGPGTSDLYNSRIEGAIHYVGNNAIGFLVTAKGQVSKGFHLDLQGEWDSGTGQVRIKNQGYFYGFGTFYVAQTQPSDDLSTALAHEFQERNPMSAEFLAASRTIASANTLTVPGNSPVWDVTGVTQINAFAAQTMWEGRVFSLRFAAAATVRHLAATIELQGNVNFIAAAGNLLTFVYHNSVAYEIGRKT